MEIDDSLLRWLDAGDVSIRYQLHRDLLDDDQSGLQTRISTEGWGARFLAAQRPDGHWGKAFYSPKWTSTHYTLLDLRLLCLHPEHPAPHKAIAQILTHNTGEDGGVNPHRSKMPSDVCVNGMFLNYACYFHTPELRLRPIVDFLIDSQLPDGGFNCESNRAGAMHSSLHTTLSVLEGLLAYRCTGYDYRLDELHAIEMEARGFVLMHRLFKSDHTGEVISSRFLLLSYPPRWFYDILKALDYFQAAGAPYDPRMQDAIDVVLKKCRKDGRWPLQGKHAGRLHFEMESGREPSRWNTLRALRVLRRLTKDV